MSGSFSEHLRFLHSTFQTWKSVLLFLYNVIGITKDFWFLWELPGCFLNQVGIGAWVEGMREEAGASQFLCAKSCITYKNYIGKSWLTTLVHWSSFCRRWICWRAHGTSSFDISVYIAVVARKRVNYVMGWVDVESILIVGVRVEWGWWKMYRDKYGLWFNIAEEESISQWEPLRKHRKLLEETLLLSSITANVMIL